jgi:hypothetical protein
MVSMDAIAIMLYKLLPISFYLLTNLVIHRTIRECAKFFHHISMGTAL